MTELRCPVGPRRLFARIDRTEAVVQVSCADCRKLVRQAYPDIVHVLHCYSVLTGEPEYTLWQWPTGQVTRENQPPLRAFRGGRS